MFGCMYACMYAYVYAYVCVYVHVCVCRETLRTYVTSILSCRTNWKVNPSPPGRVVSTACDDRLFTCMLAPLTGAQAIWGGLGGMMMVIHDGDGGGDGGGDDGEEEEHYLLSQRTEQQPQQSNLCGGDRPPAWHIHTHTDTNTHVHIHAYIHTETNKHATPHTQHMHAQTHDTHTRIERSNTAHTSRTYIHTYTRTYVHTYIHVEVICFNSTPALWACQPVGGWVPFRGDGEKSGLNEILSGHSWKKGRGGEEY